MDHVSSSFIFQSFFLRDLHELILGDLLLGSEKESLLRHLPLVLELVGWTS